MDGLFWTSHQHWWERVDNMLVDLHLSVTNRLSRARAWMARFTDRNTNHCAISLPPELVELSVVPQLFELEENRD